MRPPRVQGLTVQRVVGAAIVRDGRVLAARRSGPPALAGGWEFPGGKVEAGETDDAALVRECREELGVEVRVGPRIGAAQDRGIRLVLFAATLAGGEPVPLEDHDDLRWLAGDELAAVEWLPIDAALLAVVGRLLMREAVPVRFRATLRLHGKSATGFAVPEEIVAGLGSGKRPAVRVTINGYEFRTTVAPMGGEYLVGVNAENRAAAGVAAGEDLDVEIELDTEPREVTVPADLDAALATDEAARAQFNRLSYTHRKEWVRWVEEAKRPETRTARLAKTVAALAAGQRGR